MKFSHLDADGTARMVDVSEKPVSRRTASATAEIRLNRATVTAILDEALPKGDVLTVAKLAGINAAKANGSIIPLCHVVTLDHVDVDFTVLEDRVVARSTVVNTGRTGAEMEALAAAVGATLGIYDMCKAVDKEMEIQNVRLLEKSKVEVTT
jgi:cyclic pyranopterin phosphate synthase